MLLLAFYSALKVVAQESSPDINSTLPIYMGFAAASYCDDILNSKPSYPCGSGYNNSCDPTGILSQTEIKFAIKDNQSTAEAYVAVNGPLESIIVSFRGTSNKKLLAFDLAFWSTVIDSVQQRPSFSITNPSTRASTQNVKVHAGFQALYNKLKDPLMAQVMALAVEFPTYKIKFIGHSLGSALASLAAIHFASISSLHDRIWMILFGTPRIGNKNWMELVDSMPFANRIYRIGNKGGTFPFLILDPVLHLPPSFLNYYHHLRQYQVDLKDTNDFRANACAVSSGGESADCLQDFGVFDMENHKNYFGTKLGC